MKDIKRNRALAPDEDNDYELLIMNLHLMNMKNLVNLLLKHFQIKK